MNNILPEFIRFGRAECGELLQAERREWWLANGLGGYAAGTLSGTLTRRYHGLLIAPVNPPLGRILVFAKAETSLVDGNHSWPLYSNRWASGVIEPQGYIQIESFKLDGRMPTWQFAIGDIILDMRIWMEAGANTSYIAYRLKRNLLNPERKLQLQIKLLINARDHHGNTSSWTLNPLLETESNQLNVSFPDWFTAYFKTCGGVITKEHQWIENFDLPLERERSLPDRDEHLCVGQATLDLLPMEWVGITASLHDNASTDLDEAMKRFQSRDLALLNTAKSRIPELKYVPEWINQLILAADSFLFSRPLSDFPDGESIIAGYPWFGDWGRDTMIALPGITLSTGRYSKAKNILNTFSRFIDQGMLPNMFPGKGAIPEYNTVDAALWYIEAWRAYVEISGDEVALKDVLSVLDKIIGWYEQGTRYQIHMDNKDGLIYAGEHGVQLTWMDAKIGEWVVTPRIGKTVEINALWYNALKTMEQFASQVGISSNRYHDMAEKTRNGFNRFLNAENGGLYDLLDGPIGNDESIRPNQIFTVSLFYSPLDKSAQVGIVSLCGRVLLTSYGLRSLAPSHPDYHPYYSGGVLQRDSAYHQGTVWTWLLGHYALAEFRVTGDAREAQKWLEPVKDHLSDAGLGTVSEIFDGSPPHYPRGCPAQAWSVACILDAWLRLEKEIRKSKKD